MTHDQYELSEDVRQLQPQGSTLPAACALHAHARIWQHCTSDQAANFTVNTTSKCFQRAGLARLQQQNRALTNHGHALDRLPEPCAA